MKKQLFLLLFLSIAIFTLGQPPKRTFQRNINTPGYDSYYPAVSGDGNSLLFTSNFNNEGGTTIRYTYKMNASEWSEPVDLPRTLNITHLQMEGAYCLNFDGKEIYLSNKKRKSES